MADISDVSNALVSVISALVYPAGPSNPSASGVPTKIYAGWPEAKTLDADIRAGITTISVFPSPSMEKVVRAYGREWTDQVRGTPTIAAAVAGAMITLSGTISAGNYIAATVRGVASAYGILASDTLATVATALAALINVATPASAAGAVITLAPTSAGRVTTRAGAPGIISQEVRRQSRAYQIIIWSPSNEARIATATVVDAPLSEIDSLAVPDLSATWITYQGSFDTDGHERNTIFRRDLLFRVEYATTIVMAGTPIAAFPTTVTGLPPNSPDLI